MCSKSEDHCLGKTPKYVKLIIAWGGRSICNWCLFWGGNPTILENPPHVPFKEKMGLDAVRFFSDKKLKDSQVGDVIHWYFVSERD